MGIDVNVLVTELAVGVISSLGSKIAKPLRTLSNREVHKDLELAEWFGTYDITDHARPDVPEPPVGFDERELRELLDSNELHAILHELFATRLTDAPEQDVVQLRSAFQSFGAHKSKPWPAEYLAELFDALDYILAGVVGRLEGAIPAELERLRSQARTTRITAILGAIRRHTEALTGQVDVEAERVYLASYRRHVIELYGVIEPPDFNQRRRVRIADLYVSPTIVEVAEFRRFPVDVWAIAEGLDRTVLLGDPGCGKTTASRVLMHHHATDVKRRIPFLVTLRDFASQGPPARSVVGHIEHELDTRLQHPAPPGLISRLLLNGAAVVLFDGLDELLDPARRADVSAIIERFCTEYPLAPVLVTSRVVGYDQARLDDSQFTRVRIHGFTDAGMAEYAHKWFAQEDGLTAAEADEWADAFVTESRTAKDLRANPLLLALMCILYRGEGSIPRNRNDVYERCADLLFRRWDSHRRIYARLRVARDSDTVIRRILQHLAFWLLTRDTAQTAVTEKQLIAETVRYLTERTVFNAEDEANEAALEFVEFCRGRAWVFNDVGTTSDGEHLYTFTHRTFLEYFAARQLASMHDTPEQLAAVLADQIAVGGWPVVAPLAIQVKDHSIDRGAERILLRLLDDETERTVDERIRVLSLIGECLPWTILPTEAVVRMAKEIVDLIATRRTATGIVDRGLTPLAMLTTECWPVRDTVRDTLVETIEAQLASPDAMARLAGFSLVVSLNLGEFELQDTSHEDRQSRELALYWSDVETALFHKHRATAIDAAGSHGGMLTEILHRGLATIDEIVTDQTDLSIFFAASTHGIYGVRLSGRAIRTTKKYIEQGGESPDFVRSELRSLGSALIRRGPEQYRTARPEVWPLGRGKDTSPCPDRDIFLAAALTIAVSAEGVTRSRSLELGPMNYFMPYLRRRWDGGSDTLPPLPVPDAWQTAFEAWADNDHDFVIPNPLLRRRIN